MLKKVSVLSPSARTTCCCRCSANWGKVRIRPTKHAATCISDDIFAGANISIHGKRVRVVRPGGAMHAHGISYCEYVGFTCVSLLFRKVPFPSLSHSRVAPTCYRSEKSTPASQRTSARQAPQEARKQCVGPLACCSLMRGTFDAWQSLCHLLAAASL